MLLCRNLCDNPVPDVYFVGPNSSVMFCSSIFQIYYHRSRKTCARFTRNLHIISRKNNPGTGISWGKTKPYVLKTGTDRPRWTALKVDHHRCLQESTYPRLLKDTSPAGYTHNSAVAMGHMDVRNKSTSKYFHFTSVITIRFGIHVNHEECVKVIDLDSRPPTTN